MKRGFLLMNTGSPDAPSKAALRVYLRQFLMDPYVIDRPWLLRAILVHGFILPRRPLQSAAAYQKIWTENGSPLIHYCRQLLNKLRPAFNEPLEIGMAYGNPSFSQALRSLLERGVEEVGLLPLFPHYAMATVGSCTAVVKKELKKRRPAVTLRAAPPFYLEETYIKPLAESLKGVKEHILFSYHGLPVRHLRKTDPTASHCFRIQNCCQIPSPAHAVCYRRQCFETTAAIVKAARIPLHRRSISFQSRLGRARWLEPYTEELLRTLPRLGIRKLAVICPAFFCDCLETLEEIEMRGREIFLESGGKSLHMIPCLNDTPPAVECLKKLIRSAQSWPLV